LSEKGITLPTNLCSHAQSTEQYVDADRGLVYYATYIEVGEDSEG
jgi:hypothetical protein